MRHFLECIPNFDALPDKEKVIDYDDDIDSPNVGEETEEMVEETADEVSHVEPEKVSSRNQYIFRIPKNKDLPYTQIHNESLQDRRLSWAAKGLLSYLLSLPSNWNMCASEIKNHAANGRDAFYNCLNELKGHGYIHMMREKKSNGKFSQFITLLYEHPSLNPYFKECAPLTEKPEAVKPPYYVGSQPLPGKPYPVKAEMVPPLPGKPLPGKPYPVNPQLQINNKQINNKQNNNNIGHAPHDPIYLASSKSTKTKKGNLGDFEKFWGIYPNKKGKHMAYRAYHEKSIKLTDNETMMKAVEAQIKERQEKLNRNIWCEEWARGSTWLNQRRWEDVITTFAVAAAADIPSRPPTRTFPTHEENAAWWKFLTDEQKRKYYERIPERERERVDALLKYMELDIFNYKFIGSEPYHDMMKFFGKEQM